MELTADFNDILWEPPETEFQPLLDFENEVLSEVPHNDISLLTQRIKRSFLDYVRQGIMLDAVRRYRLYKRSIPRLCRILQTRFRAIALLLQAHNSSGRNLSEAYQSQI
jgi:hypothetical protein